MPMLIFQAWATCASSMSFITGLQRLIGLGDILLDTKLWFCYSQSSISHSFHTEYGRGIQTGVTISPFNLCGDVIGSGWLSAQIGT